MSGVPRAEAARNCAVSATPRATAARPRPPPPRGIEGRQRGRGRRAAREQNRGGHPPSRRWRLGFQRPRHARGAGAARGARWRVARPSPALGRAVEAENREGAARGGPEGRDGRGKLVPRDVALGRRQRQRERREPGGDDGLAGRTRGRDDVRRRRIRRRRGRGRGRDRRSGEPRRTPDRVQKSSPVHPGRLQPGALLAPRARSRRTDPRDRHARKRRTSKSESRKGSSGAGFPDARRAERRRRGASAASPAVPSAISCPMIARPPPGDAGIPGTERGVDRRGPPRPSAMPDVMEACLVRPMSDGWPDAWNPVAASTLPSSADPTPSAFDKLSEVLTPREDDGDVPEEGTRPRPADRGRRRRRFRAGRDWGFGGRRLGVSVRRAAATRRRAAATPRARSWLEGPSRDPRVSSPRRPRTAAAWLGRAGRSDRPAPASDDTGSVHSGGSMAEHRRSGVRDRTRDAPRRRARRAGGWVRPFVVSDELLPADVRRSVAATVGGRRRRAAETQPAPAVTRRRVRRRIRRSSGTAEALVGGEERDVSESIGERRGTGAREPTRTLKDLLGDAAAVVRRGDPAPGRASPRCEPRSRRTFESARCGSSCRATSRTRRTRRRRPRCPRPTSDPLGASCGTGTPSPPSTPCPPGTCPGTRPRRTAGPRPISSPVTSPAAPWIRGSRPTGSPPTAPWVYPPPGARRARSLITRSFTSATTRARRRAVTPACPPANRAATRGGRGTRAATAGTR